MPLVKVEMIKGHTKEYKHIVLDCIHQGLVDGLGIEDWDQFQRIIEIDEDDFEIPSFKTKQFMIIELTIFPGRSKEAKGKAIKLITKYLHERLDIPVGDVFIIINEPKLENWGMAGKQKG